MSFISRPFFYFCVEGILSVFTSTVFFKCSGLVKACVLFILSVTSHEEECKFRE